MAFGKKNSGKNSGGNSSNELLDAARAATLPGANADTVIEPQVAAPSQAVDVPPAAEPTVADSDNLWGGVIESDPPEAMVPTASPLDQTNEQAAQLPPEMPETIPEMAPAQEDEALIGADANMWRPDDSEPVSNDTVDNDTSDAMFSKAEEEPIALSEGELIQSEEEQTQDEVVSGDVEIDRLEGQETTPFEQTDPLSASEPSEFPAESIPSAGEEMVSETPASVTDHAAELLKEIEEGLSGKEEDESTQSFSGESIQNEAASQDEVFEETVQDTTSPVAETGFETESTIPESLPEENHISDEPGTTDFEGHAFQEEAIESKEEVLQVSDVGVPEAARQDSLEGDESQSENFSQDHVGESITAPLPQDEPESVHTMSADVPPLSEEVVAAEAPSIQQKNSEAAQQFLHSSVQELERERIELQKEAERLQEENERLQNNEKALEYRAQELEQRNQSLLNDVQRQQQQARELEQYEEALKKREEELVHGSSMDSLRKKAQDAQDPDSAYTLTRQLIRHKRFLRFTGIIWWVLLLAFGAFAFMAVSEVDTQAVDFNALILLLGLVFTPIILSFWTTRRVSRLARQLKVLIDGSMEEAEQNSQGEE